MSSMWTQIQVFQWWISSKLLHQENSQDAPLKEAIIFAFSRHGLDYALKKMVFLLSDGASVNSGSHFGLIRLFQEGYPWLAFVWCYSHRLLHWKMHCRNSWSPWTLCWHIYSISIQTPQHKHRELTSLYQEVKGQYEMYDSGLKPLKGGGTRWIAHKLKAIGRLLEKFGLYVGHLKDSTSSAKNSATCTTL